MSKIEKADKHISSIGSEVIAPIPWVLCGHKKGYFLQLGVSLKVLAGNKFE